MVEDWSRTHHDGADCGTHVESRENYPDWLHEAVQEFKEYGLKPYRPPRFSDGVCQHVVVDELEEEYDIEIRFLGMDVREGDPWETQIDGRTIDEVQRHRHQDGYSVFEMESSEFVEWIRTTVEDERHTE